MSTNTKLADPCLALWQAMNEAEKVGNRTDDKLIVKFLREAGYCIVPIAAHDAEQAQEPFAYVHKRGQEDEEFIHAVAVNGPCPDCEPLFLGSAPAEQAAQAVPVPQGLARSDAEFWMRNRTAILQAIADQGLTLVSTAHGCRLMKFGRAETQAAPAPEAPKSQCLWPSRGSCLAWRQAAPASERLKAAPQAQTAGQELSPVDFICEDHDSPGLICKSCAADGKCARAALAQRQPLTVPHPGSPEAKAMIDSELALRDWPANHFNAARAGYEACRKLAGLGIGATTGKEPTP